MKYESIAHMHQMRLRDKAAGVKRGPLHTLQECCEAAGISPSWFGRWSKKYPDAPQPIVTTAGGAARFRRAYYCRADFVQWVNQTRQQIQAEKKGTIMPDLQTELSKVINQWSEPEVTAQPTQPERKPHLFPATTGTSRATSEYILAHSGASRHDIVEALVSRGHNRATVYALLVQMKRQGLVTEVDGRFTPHYTEYTPLKSYATWKNAQAKQTKSKPRKSIRAAKAAAYEEHENYNPTARVVAPKVVAAPEFDAEAFANSLTLKQARAVYQELKKVFE